MKKMSLPLSADIKLPVIGRGDWGCPCSPCGECRQSCAGNHRGCESLQPTLPTVENLLTEGDRCIHQWTQTKYFRGQFDRSFCLFNRTVLSSLLGTTASPAIGFWPDSQHCKWISFYGPGPVLVRKRLLVAAAPVHIVPPGLVHSRGHWCSFPQRLAWHFWECWCAASRADASVVPAWFPYVWRSNVCYLLQSYHLVLMGSQQWQLLIFWGVLFDQQLKGDYPTTGSGIFTDLPMTSGDSFKCWHDLPGCWE